MAHKDLVVLVDAEPASRGRIALAAIIAYRSGAHLVGLYAEIALELPRRLGYFDLALLDPLYREVETASRGRAQEMRAIFEDIAIRSAYRPCRAATWEGSPVAKRHSADNACGDAVSGVLPRRCSTKDRCRHRGSASFRLRLPPGNGFLGNVDSGVYRDPDIGAL
jgi:hypothetical protein